MSISITSFLHEATILLKRAGIDAPRRSAEILLGHCLRQDRVSLIAHGEDLVLANVEEIARTLIQRRATGEPVAYLVGHKEFYGREFRVTPDTLIPRPASEHLIDHVLKVLPDTPLHFADMGTGSGCLAVTLAAERRAWRGLMLDINYSALRVAQENACNIGVHNRLLAIQGDMVAPPLTTSSLDFCISNPPYISHREFMEISHEVRSFEPKDALFSPADGLAHLTALALRALELLRPGGLLIMEHGAQQGQAVREILQQYPLWDNIVTYKDFAGLERFCQARKKN